MRSHSSDDRDLTNLEPIPEHFDSMEAVEANEYYDKGVVITLKVPKHSGDGQDDGTVPQFLKRQILKTDSCEMHIPEIDFTIPSGRARFGTLHSFLEEILDNLKYMSGIPPPSSSSSSSTSSGANGPTALQSIFDILHEMMSGKREFTIILNDPLGNSAIQVISNQGKTTYDSDPQINVSYFTRSLYHCELFDIPIEKGNCLQPISEEKEAYDMLIKLLTESKKIVALTGAGVSTESKIPAFRNRGADEVTKLSGEAIWSKYNPYEISDYQKFVKDEQIRVAHYHKFCFYYKAISSAKTNPAHELFGFLNKRKQLHQLITQNIDGLHSMVEDMKGDMLLELHGNGKVLKCINCKDFETVTESKIEEIEKMISADDPKAPKCSKCGGFVKPNYILFNESLDSSVIEKAKKSVSESDLFIVMGSSLLVAPANTLIPLASSCNVPIIIVNMDDTDYDRYASVLIRNKVGELSSKVMSHLSELDSKM